MGGVVVRGYLGEGGEGSAVGTDQLEWGEELLFFPFQPTSCGTSLCLPGSQDQDRWQSLGLGTAASEQLGVCWLVMGRMVVPSAWRGVIAGPVTAACPSLNMRLPLIGPSSSTLLQHQCSTPEAAFRSRPQSLNF